MPLAEGLDDVIVAQCGIGICLELDMNYYDRFIRIKLAVVRTPVAWRGVLGGRVGRWCGWSELGVEPGKLLL